MKSLVQAFEFKKSPLLVIGTAGCVIFAILLLLRSDNRKVLLGEYQALKEQIKVLDKNEKNAKTLVQDMDQVDTKIGSPDDLFPEASQTTRLLRYFLTLEEASRVKVTSPKQMGFSPLNLSNFAKGSALKSTTVAGTDLGYINYQMQVEGPYSNVLEFIQRLYSDKFFCKVQELQMRGMSLEVQGRVSAALTVQVLGKATNQKQ
jgi:hypothetical protein